MAKDDGVKDIDRGWKNIKAKLALLDSLSVTVGIQGKDAQAKKKTRTSSGITTPGKPTLVQIATVHEFGYPAGKIPPRPFIRSTVSEEARKIARMQRATVEEALDPKSSMNAVKRKAKRLGVYLQGKIRNKIVAIQSPGLKEATKRKKARTLRGAKRAAFIAGSGNPLVDTGQLKSSITFQVRIQGIAI